MCRCEQKKQRVAWEQRLNCKLELWTTFALNSGRLRSLPDSEMYRFSDLYLFSTVSIVKFNICGELSQLITEILGYFSRQFCLQVFIWKKIAFLLLLLVFIYF